MRNFKYILYAATFINIILLIFFFQIKQKKINEIRSDIIGAKAQLNTLHKKIIESISIDSLERQIDSLKQIISVQTNTDKALLDSTANINKIFNSKLVSNNSLLKILLSTVYIVDSLSINDFNYDTLNYKGFRFIRFKDLATILGKRLPIFKTAPRVILFSYKLYNLRLGIVTTDGVYIKSNSTENIKFNLWMVYESAKPNIPPTVRITPDKFTIQLSQ